MNDLTEVKDHVCEDDYYMRLFAQGNDYAMCVDIIKEIFSDAEFSKEVPSLEDVIIQASIYNDEVMLELTDAELMLLCPNCEYKSECWGNFDPWGDKWPEDECNLDSCRTCEFEANYDYASYNYGLSNMESLVVSILLDLKYCVKVGEADWEYVYDNPWPSYLPKDYHTYFNDAQMALIPEMEKKPTNIMNQLRLTG